MGGYSVWRMLLALTLVFASPILAQTGSAVTEQTEACGLLEIWYEGECVSTVISEGAGSETGEPTGSTPDLQPSTLCNAVLSPEVAAGEYIMKGGALLLMVNNYPMHPDPAQEDTLTMIAGAHPASEFVLTGLPSGMPAEIGLRQIQSGSGPAWDFLRTPVVGMDIAAIGFDQPCDVGALPMLEGEFSTRSQDGYDIAHQFRLVALSERHFAGIWNFQAIGTPSPVIGTRSIELLGQ